MILIGELSLWVALQMAIWAATVSFAGGALRRRDLTVSGERAIVATLVMIVLASAGLWTALFAHDFSIRYVASFSSANLPKVYLFTAFWAGQPGSLLFWSLILAACSATVVYSNRARNRQLMPYVSGTLAIVLVFFLASLCLGRSPFERLDWVPPDGRGMNPQLQNPGTVIYKPSLYLGYAATTIPFAFVIAALIRRTLDSAWRTAIRQWTLISWFFITTGMVLGMWWAYVEHGRGGYWAWSAVENASLLPWLANTALLHSIVVEEKRGTLGRWNVTLVVSAFLFSIFATFMVLEQAAAGTRFGRFDKVIIPLALMLLLLTGIGSLLSWRRASPRKLQRQLVRSGRRYGGYIGHMGIAVIVVGFAGLAFGREFDMALVEGQSRELADPYGHKWRFVSQGFSQYDVLNRQVTALTLDLSRDGKRVGVLTTEQRQYVDSRGAPTFEPSTEAGIHNSWRQDVYVVLARVGDGRIAAVHVSFIPLLRWVWLGGALMALGGLIMMWPIPGPRGADS